MSRCADAMARTVARAKAGWRAATVVALVFTLAAVARAQDDAIIAPVRASLAGAPLSLTVWWPPAYFPLAARPAIDNACTVVLDDWARSHPGAQLKVSVTTCLELHKTKLQLAAAAGRLPDVASI